MRGLLLVGSFVLLSCISTRDRAIKLETNFNHTVFYSKADKDAGYSWSKVNKVSDLKFLLDRQGNNGSPRIIFDRVSQVDTFILASFETDEVKSGKKSYTGFDFIGTFETVNSPFDYYFDFYINASNNDVLQITQRVQNKKFKENMGILYTHDSINYLGSVILF